MFGVQVKDKFMTKNGGSLTHIVPVHRNCRQHSWQTEYNGLNNMAWNHMSEYYI